MCIRDSLKAVGFTLQSLTQFWVSALSFCYRDLSAWWENLSLIHSFFAFVFKLFLFAKSVKFCRELF